MAHTQNVMRIRYNMIRSLNPFVYRLTVALCSLCSAFTSESNTITIWNNGKGIPVVEHKDEKMYVPALIFGHLLTSSNYDDEEKKVTGERRHLKERLPSPYTIRRYNSVSTICLSRRKERLWCQTLQHLQHQVHSGNGLQGV